MSKVGRIREIIAENANKSAPEVVDLIVTDELLKAMGGTEIDPPRAWRYYYVETKKDGLPHLKRRQRNGRRTDEEERALAEEAAAYLSRLGKRRVAYNGSGIGRCIS